MVGDNMFLKMRIRHYLKDLPYNKKLAKTITKYVKENKDYNLAQIGSIIDRSYGGSCGLGIAEDIKCLG